MWVCVCVCVTIAFSIDPARRRRSVTNQKRIHIAKQMSILLEFILVFNILNRNIYIIFYYIILFSSSKSLYVLPKDAYFAVHQVRLGNRDSLLSLCAPRCECVLCACVRVCWLLALSVCVCVYICVCSAHDNADLKTCQRVWKLRETKLNTHTHAQTV